MSRQVFPSAEFDIINVIRQISGCYHNDSYEIGIGDDAAVRCSDTGERLIFTTDISVEGVHFSLETMSLQEAAYRAMVSNISDCAAMGVEPDSALVQLVFPDSCSDLKQKIVSVYQGFAQSCSRWKFPVVGGDLSRGGQWVFGITLLGKASSGQRILKRKGARDGDNLWISGFPGRSGAGLEVLKRWGRDNIPQNFVELAENHIKPVPRIEAGVALAADREVHALMDLSDGLSKDCRTLSYENGLGIILNFDTLQIPEAMVQLSADTGIPVQEWYLHGGEDYELLFAASAGFDPSGIPPEYCAGLFCIGRFTDEYHGLLLEKGGSLSGVTAGSWDHIRL